MCANMRHACMVVQVLGTGELKGAVTIKAAAFSEAAKTKIEAAGAKAELVPQKPKWTRVAHKKMVEALKVRAGRTCTTGCSVQQAGSKAALQ